MQHKLYTVIVILLSLVLSGIVAVYQQQAENQAILQQLLGSQLTQPSVGQDLSQLVPLLKSIQSTQTEQGSLLAKLAATQSELNKVPASKMKKFKQGAYKPAKATGY
jgi:hypothetical protein